MSPIYGSVHCSHDGMICIDCKKKKKEICILIYQCNILWSKQLMRDGTWLVADRKSVKRWLMEFQNTNRPITPWPWFHNHRWNTSGLFFINQIFELFWNVKQICSFTGNISTMTSSSVTKPCNLPFFPCNTMSRLSVVPVKHITPILLLYPCDRTQMVLHPHIHIYIDRTGLSFLIIIEWRNCLNVLFPIQCQIFAFSDWPFWYLLPAVGNLLQVLGVLKKAASLCLQDVCCWGICKHLKH